MTERKLGMEASRVGAKVLLTGGIFLMGGTVIDAAAQQISSVPDAQVEANVLKTLAGVSALSSQDIQSSTVYGVVTLSGTVQTEALRTQAENLVARTAGVKKVVDELALGTPPPVPAASAEENSSQPDSDGQQPVLQSDGSYAPQPAEPAAPYAGAPPQQPSTAYGAGAQAAGNPAPAQPGYGAAPAYPSQPYGSQPNTQQAYGQPPNQPGYPQPYSQPGYPPAYGQSAPPANGYTQQGYAPQTAYAPPGGQQPGIQVTVPAGALLRIRINRGLDSNHLRPGTPFDGTVLNDVATTGQIAIPRGAAVQGTVVDAHKAGALKGEGELSLQIDSVTLGGMTYPLQSTLWERQGADKSVRTVNSALGLGVLGAIIGGVAGGGAGAAVGAGVGAGAGVAGSAASQGGRVIIPPEAVLTFHLAEPAVVQTVSEQEMQRLAYAAGPGPGAQPVVRRRYYSPYYAPAPYPYPY